MITRRAATQGGSLVKSRVSMTTKPAWRLYWPLVVMAFLAVVAWIPWFLQGTFPTTIVDHVRITPTGLPMFAPNRTSGLNVYIGNRSGPLAQDVRWRTRLALVPAMSSEMSERAAWEQLESVSYLPPTDLGESRTAWQTIRTRQLGSRDVEDLKAGRMHLYLVGQIQYRDNTGRHETQFCQKLQEPGDLNIWNLCIQHNTIR